MGGSPMVQICLLGGLRVTTDDGTPVDVGPAKQQTLLAALALSVGDAVPVARLIDVVWGESAPRTAEKTLQGYVAGLRKELGGAAIARTGAAYRLDVDPATVDVHRFRRHLGAGEADPALAEWAGTPLAGLNAPGLQPAADGLVEQWLSLVEADLERRVDTDAPAVVATLTQLTADYPFREELWALLMTALYRSGRQADALTAYQRARLHLVEELGVEPGPRLRELEGQILGQDERLRPDMRPPEPVVGPRSTVAGNLPARRTRLWGRDADLDGVATAVEASSVVTLIGPGGVGKTVLALAAAQGWQRGDEQDNEKRVWLIELAKIGTSADVLRTVAETLGVVEGPTRTLTDSVVAALRSRPTLVVLDNCEHVIDATAALASAVANQSPDTRVLATSREGLAIAGEQLMVVEPLDAAGAAAELFAERAGAVSRDFRLDECREVVTEICRRLDGVPLAIELAAARTRSLTPTQLLSRLDDRLRLLTRGHRTGADRHRTLRATVGWSYDLLDPAQRALFETLSVFTGPFDLTAAEAVATRDDVDAVDVDQLLGDLVDRSLVRPETGPFGRRFRLLETLRQFAAEQLCAHGDPDEVARRHARWCRDQVAAVHGLLTGPGEVQGVARLAELWPNLRAAVDWACNDGDVALADALVRPIAPEVNMRRQAEIGDWAERILELLPPEDGDMTVFWLSWAVNRHMQAYDDEAYERVIGRYGYTDHPLIRYTHAYLYEDDEETADASPAAVAWLRDQGEHKAAGLVEVAGVAAGMLGQGRFAELDALATQMRERYETQGPPTLLYWALGLLGFSAQFQGRHDDAARFFTESGGVDIPPGTYLVNRPIEARLMFEQGQRSRAFRMLRDHVDALLDTDYVDVARMVAVEFVSMVAAVDRVVEAARVLDYLDTTGRFGVLVRETFLADAVRRITAEQTCPEEGVPLDGRRALIYMRDVLDEVSSGAACSP